MARVVRIEIYVVGKLSVLELDDGEHIVGVSSDGERASIVTARDVTIDDPRSPVSLTEWKDAMGPGGEKWGMGTRRRES